MSDAADAQSVVDGWLRAFFSAAQAQDRVALEALFEDGSWWRDLVTLTWDLRTFHGPRQIAEGLVASRAGQRLVSLTPRADEPPTLVGSPTGDMVEGFLSMRTDIATGTAVLRLRDAGEGVWKAWTLLTAMEDLIGFEGAVAERRPLGNDVHETGALPWHVQRESDQTLTSGEPTVLVVGAGQGGLSIAAQLSVRGIRTLVIEKNPRIGDNWRNRYESLVLHDPVWADHLPFLKFPDTWPVYSPKDKLADWLEGYARSLDLNVWTGTTLGASSFDEEAGAWTVSVTLPDGTSRTLHPRHVVLATGAVGDAVVPDLPGMSNFTGPMHHSSTESTVDVPAGTKVVVIGTGNSGHDIAQAYSQAGADVTMIQRGGTYVMSQKKGIPALFGSMYSERGPSLWKADLVNASFPYLLQLEFAKAGTAEIAALDAELLEGLAAAGFDTGIAADGTDEGLMGRALRRAGGYYIDVGCSQLIIDGKIKVRSGVGVETFTASGVTLDDGVTLEADVVVLATGFANMRETARRLFGDAVADRCGLVWDLDNEGEIRTLWRRSGHPRFWFMGGSLLAARMHSQWLALQILGIETGAAPDDVAS